MPTIIDLTNLGSAGVTITGSAAFDYAGTSVSSAGDVNGDGFDDVVVGAHGSDGGGDAAGAAFVIFGAQGGFGPTDLGSLAPGAGFAILGATPNEQLGTSLASAGDVNGDGFDDLIVGSPNHYDFANPLQGAAYVIFGKAEGFGTIDLATLSATDGFAIHGDEEGDSAGFSVSGGGDINGDGFDDIIVGAPFGGDSPYVGGLDKGEVYVVFGKASGLATVDLTTFQPADPNHDPAAGFMIVHGDDQTGHSVHNAGDVNGDGYDDLIIGAPFAGGALTNGAAYVVFGKEDGLGVVELGELEAEDGFVINGVNDSIAGWSVSGGGDVNGDGFDDLIVGAPYSNASGEAYVIFGKSTGFGTVDLANLGTAGFAIRADAAGDRAGFSVSSAGDVNGDGFDDVIVGAFLNDDGGTSAGAAYVIFGKAAGFATVELSNLDPAAGFVIQDDIGDFMGKSVSAAGDVNGDGFADVIVGASYGDNNGGNAGEAYVIFGVAPTGAVTRNGSAGGQTIRGGAFDDTLRGLGGNDTLIGAAGDDLLDGGVGVDVMRGGAGDDTYVADNEGDQAIEGAGLGTDLVNSSAGFTLGANVENLRLTGSSAISGTGNGLANILTGNAAANLLDGAAGADVMNGGGGNDIYVVDNGGDQVVESSSGGGTDTVRSAISYSLGANLENLLLTGSGPTGGTGNGLANSLTGNAAANVLNGGGSDDRLDGRAGADTMSGGTGDDLYVVDNAGDQAIESSAAGGTDSVESSISFALGAHLEHLTLTGTGAANAAGNGLANRLTGNSAANRLDGGAGADELCGGGGNDVYIVDHAGDLAIETSGTGGTDEVRSSVAFTLGANVENLVLTGGAPVSGRGNALANSLTGNGAANFLNGAAGADIMTGGGGNDGYAVDHAGDQVVEAGGGGTDRVSSAISYTLGDHVEHLTLTGIAAIDGTGNALGNTMAGNGGKNRLEGGDGGDGIRGGGSIDTLFGNAGNDRLYGGTGSDSLTGGGGQDGYYFDTALGATNVDTIEDFSPASDTIFLDRDIFTGLAASGPLAAGAFRNGTVAADADDRILYHAATGELRYDPDGAGGAAAILFARVDPGTVLTHADFVGYI